MELWPYNGYQQHEVGPRVVTVVVGGDTIEEAMAQAQMFKSGALTNWRVWKAPIFAIEQVDGVEAQNLTIGEWVGETEIKGKTVQDRSGNRHVVTF
jgi:hypothetical protein